jgi:hypothetical protein
MEHQPVSQLQFSRYMRLIEYAKQNPPDGRVERHHIVPRSMGGSDSKDNLVPLTPRLHFVAHWLLWKAYKNSKMANAFWTMACCNEERINSKTYSIVRKISAKAISIAKKGKTTSDRHKAIMRERMTGRVVSEETRKKLSEANKGRKVSPEMRAQMSERNKGKKHSEETKAKMSVAKKGKPTTTTGKTNKRTTPVTLEQRQKMSERRIGTKMTPESSEKKRQAMMGKKLPLDVLERLKIYWKSEEFRVAHSKRMKEHFEMKRKMQQPPLPWVTV